LNQLDLVLAKMVGDQALRLRALAQLDKPIERLGEDLAQLFTPFDTTLPRLYAWLAAERG
jgi:hypothetical protein